jgi:hypothetical protein
MEHLHFFRCHMMFILFDQINLFSVTVRALAIFCDNLRCFMYVFYVLIVF